MKIEWRFYEDLQDLLELTHTHTHTHKCPFHHRGLECKSRKSRDTWSKRQAWPWIQNGAGQRLTELRQENILVILNTLFKQYKRWLYTWTSPDGQSRNQIDYILCSQRQRNLHSQKKQDQELTVAQLQFSSVTQSCPTLCDPMNHSMPGLPVHHQLPEFTQTHVHRVSHAIQPSHHLSSLSSPVCNLSQHQGLF